MANHNFVSSTSGDLCNPHGDVIRHKFAYTHRNIDKSSELLATLRAGEFSSIGGYRIVFVTADGQALSFAAVRAELYQCVWSLVNDVMDDWRIIGTMAECEWDSDRNLYCSHSNALLFGEE